MAHFQTAPDAVLRNVPSHLSLEIQEVLRRPGTYALPLNGALNLPKGNTTWKGQQARLIAVWGGVDGERLDVVPREPVVRVDPITPAHPAPAGNVYVYLVQFQSDQIGGRCVGGTMLEGRLPVDSTKFGKKGTAFTEPLKVTILPEVPSGVPRIPPGGGNAFIDIIIGECRKIGITNPDQLAYILATAEHEGGLREPGREWWGAPTPHKEVSDENWRRTGNRVKNYYSFYGRGYVQITLRDNYKTHGERLKLPLLDDPDLALHRDVAINVLVNWFARGRLEPFINGMKPPDFVNARKTVNGLDKADEIAQKARRYQHLLLQRRGARAG